MAVNKKAPESLRGSAGEKIITVSCITFYKGTKFILSKLQREFFNLLSNGQKYSSHKLMQMLHASDPRKEVQYLRKKGINVQDEWVEATKDIPRHKLYFIDPKECGKEVSNEC